MGSAMISTHASLSMAEARIPSAARAAVVDDPALLDDAALRAGLERHHAESFGWALHCCGRRRDDAENVLQLAYLKVLSGQAVFEGRSSFKTWLFSVIRRTAAGERRAEFLRRFRSAAFLQEPRAASSPPASDALERNQLRDQVEAALRALPSRQRDVVQLVFYHEVSIADAAAAMGVSLGSARTHYERAKRRIRLLIENTEAQRTT
jgi:RNA polymerase sigma-70 factor (ECF subfamily)